jgi:hypothetical protein
MFLIYAEYTAGRKSGDESDPTGSPRHEQTVAVALMFIVAQVLVQHAS